MTMGRSSSPSPCCRLTRAAAADGRSEGESAANRNTSNGDSYCDLRTRRGGYNPRGYQEAAHAACQNPQGTRKRWDHRVITRPNGSYWALAAVWPLDRESWSCAYADIPALTHAATHAPGIPTGGCRLGTSRELAADRQLLRWGSDQSRLFRARSGRSAECGSSDTRRTRTRARQPSPRQRRGV